MIPAPLVSTEWLQENLADERLRVYDTTVLMTPDPDGPRPYRIESGHERYLQGHVPGAGFLDLTGELSDRSSPIAFMMPDESHMSATLSDAGIRADSGVVLYSARTMMWSTRVWWMLRACGIDNAAVLDGGLEKWQREDRPLATGGSSYPQGSVRAETRPGLLVGKQDVAEGMHTPTTCTLNALSPEVYAGTGTHYGRPGHIPGSFNMFYDHLLDQETGTFLPPDGLRRQLESRGALAAERVITYCGGGISATMPALALTVLGHPNVAVYDGSLLEWAADPDLPLVTGADPDGPR